jgi:tRNA C32,U32 (ribose-2'-O)-methylase TrmJ
VLDSLYRILLDIELKAVDNNLIEDGFRTHEIAFVKTNHETSGREKENHIASAPIQSMYEHFQLMQKKTQEFAPIFKNIQKTIGETPSCETVLTDNTAYNHANANTDAHQYQIHLNRMKMAEENLNQLKYILNSMEEFSNHFKTKT